MLMPNPALNTMVLHQDGLCVVTRWSTTESGLSSLSAEKVTEVVVMRYVSSVSGEKSLINRACDPFGLYGQAIKRTRWMPRQPEAMKDVIACDKRWGGGK